MNATRIIQEEVKIKSAYQKTIEGLRNLQVVAKSSDEKKEFFVEIDKTLPGLLVEVIPNE